MFSHDIRHAQLLSLDITYQMTRDEALKILEQSPLSEEEGKKLFSEVAKHLEISETEFQHLFELPECTDHFKSKIWMYKIGLRLYEMLGIEKRIRK